MAAGENEIVAAQALLDCLDLGGTLVTVDAAHCQRDTAVAVLERGCQYTSLAFGNHCKVFCVKPSMNSVKNSYDNAMTENFVLHLGMQILDSSNFQLTN